MAPSSINTDLALSDLAGRCAPELDLPGMGDEEIVPSPGTASRHAEIRASAREKERKSPQKKGNRRQSEVDWLEEVPRVVWCGVPVALRRDWQAEATVASGGVLSDEDAWIDEAIDLLQYSRTAVLIPIDLSPKCIVVAGLTMWYHVARSGRD